MTTAMDRRAIATGIEQLEERFEDTYLGPMKENIHHILQRMGVTAAEWPDVIGILKIRFRGLPPAESFRDVLKDLRARNLDAQNREARAWAIHEHETGGEKIPLGWLKKIYGGEDKIPPRGCRKPQGEEVPF